MITGAADPGLPAAAKLAAAVSDPSPDFDEAFPDLHRSAYRVAYRLLGRRAEAEDVAAETLARAYERWRRLVRRGDPTPWVVRVAANLAIDSTRRRARHQAPDDVGRVRGHHLVDRPAEERPALVAALRGLPRRQREVVVLRYLCDVSESDTARALGCSTGAVKQHASRGLASLRGRLAAEGYG